MQYSCFSSHCKQQVHCTHPPPSCHSSLYLLWAPVCCFPIPGFLLMPRYLLYRTYNWSHSSLCLLWAPNSHSRPSWGCYPCIFKAIQASASCEPLFHTSVLMLLPLYIVSLLDLKQFWPLPTLSPCFPLTSCWCCPCRFDTPSKLCLLRAPCLPLRPTAVAPVYLTHHPSSVYTGSPCFPLPPSAFAPVRLTHHLSSAYNELLFPTPSCCCCPCTCEAILASDYSEPLFPTSVLLLLPLYIWSLLCLLWAPVSPFRPAAVAPAYLTHHPQALPIMSPCFQLPTRCCCPCIFDTPSKLCSLWAPVSQSRPTAVVPVYLTHHPSSAYYEPLFLSPAPLLLPLYIWHTISKLCLLWAPVSAVAPVYLKRSKPLPAVSRSVRVFQCFSGPAVRQSGSHAAVGPPPARPPASRAPWGIKQGLSPSGKETVYLGLLSFLPGIKGIASHDQNWQKVVIKCKIDF